MTYKIKGKGDTREVYDGDRLVGTLRRYEVRHETITIGRDTGRYTMRVIDEWGAFHADGSKVTYKGHPVRYRTLKAWTNPMAWGAP